MHIHSYFHLRLVGLPIIHSPTAVRVHSPQLLWSCTPLREVVNSGREPTWFRLLKQSRSRAVAPRVHQGLPAHPAQQSFSVLSRREGSAAPSPSFKIRFARAMEASQSADFLQTPPLLQPEILIPRPLRHRPPRLLLFPRHRGLPATNKYCWRRNLKPAEVLEGYFRLLLLQYCRSVTLNNTVCAFAHYVNVPHNPLVSGCPAVQLIQAAGKSPFA